MSTLKLEGNYAELVKVMIKSYELITTKKQKIENMNIEEWAGVEQ